MKKIKETLSVTGMSCAHCELVIETILSDLNGVGNINASYSKGKVSFEYDEDVIALNDIINAINASEYKAGKEEQDNKPASQGQTVYVIIIIIGIYMIMKHLGLLNVFNFFPQINENMGLGMLFIIGMLTSVHCVAMCGGINLAQSVSSAKKEHSALLPNLLYNLGRVVSYTIIGGIAGQLGSVIRLTGSFRGAVAVFAGVFMMIMGLNMLNIFPWLKKFNLKTPKFITKKVNREKAGRHSSFYIGLLNGLLPCGPLQSMQLYALSTGSFITGALSMFLFSTGTVPLMFLLGTISSKLNKKFTERMMSACAVLVVLLGIGMLNNGLALSGISVAGIKAEVSTENVAKMEGSYQTVDSNLEFGSYPAITVKEGVPVKWTITAKPGTINGCNNEIIIPEYNVRVKLREGDNLIEFTPDSSGNFGYSCWMGMIRSTIKVTE